MSDAPAERRTRQTQPPERLHFGGFKAGSTTGSRSSDTVIDLEEYDETTPPPRGESNDADYTDSTSRNASVAKVRNKRRMLADLPKDELTNLVETSQQQIRSLRTDLTDIRKKRAADRKDREMERQERIKYQRECRELKKKNSELEETVQQLRKDIQDQQQKFNEAQKEWIAKISDQTYPCLPDDIVRARFRELSTRCKDWAKEWASEVHHKFPIVGLLHIIRACSDPGESTTRSTLEQKFGYGGGSAARFLGFAAIYRAMLKFFFESTITFFRLILDSDSGISACLSRLMQLFETDGTKQAAAWRAETMRLLRAHIGGRPLELKAEQSKTEKLGRLCFIESQRIIAQLEPEFLREAVGEDRRKRLEELQDIFWDAGLLALELWSQKSVVQLVDDRMIYSMPFSADSNLTEPHLSMGVDGKDSRYEGKKIHMVITPALQLLGNAEGENMDQTKPLSKAIVIVFHPEDLPAVHPVKQEATIPAIHEQPNPQEPAHQKHILKRQGSVDDQANASKRRRMENENRGDNRATIESLNPMVPSTQAKFGKNQSALQMAQNVGAKLDVAQSSSMNTPARSGSSSSEQRNKVVVNVPPLPKTTSDQSQHPPQAPFNSQSALRSNSSWLEQLVDGVEQGNTIDRKKDQEAATANSSQSELGRERKAQQEQEGQATPKQTQERADVWDASRAREEVARVKGDGTDCSVRIKVEED